MPIFLVVSVSDDGYDISCSEYATLEEAVADCKSSFEYASKLVIYTVVQKQIIKEVDPC